MKNLALGMLLCTVSMPAWALSDPTPTNKDQHVRIEQYDLGNRTAIVLQVGEVTNISFDPMETVGNVVKTDRSPFDYPQHKDGDNVISSNLQLIGKRVGTGTLTVVTRHAAPNDEEHVYNFAVSVVDAPSKGGDDPTVTYQLTFTYPTESARPQRQVPRGVADADPPAAERDVRDVNYSPPDPPKKPLSLKERKAHEQMTIMAARMMADPLIGPQNGMYVAQGRDRNIAPVAASDNFRSTGFRYPGNMQQPSVFKVLDGVQGTPGICQGRRATAAELEAPEQAVNTLVNADELVVQETWPHWRLRLGEAVVDIWNCNYNAVGYDPGTGTNSPDTVRRVLR